MDFNQDTFFEQLKTYSNIANIIVYGASFHATAILDSLKVNNSKQKIYVAVSNTHGEDNYMSGFRIYCIKDLKHLVNNCIVIIAARSSLHDVMEITARTIGFTNFIRVNEHTISDINMNKYHYDISQIKYELKLSKYLQYETLNNMRLNDLRRKVERGCKVNVLFILSSKAKFNFSTVYKALENIGIFDITLICFSEYYYSDWFIPEVTDMKNYTSELKENGYNAIWGYDDSYLPLPIENFSPDIVIFNYPQLYDKNAAQFVHKITHNSLTCYIPYGMHVANFFNYHFENKNILPAWIHFIDTKPAYNICTINASNHGINSVLSGHPMIDEYLDIHNSKLPIKFKNKKKIIIYAPHSTVDEGNNTSSFHIFFKYFISLLDKFPDINFIFKPHPSLGMKINRHEFENRTIGIKYNEYIKYCEQWDTKPNGVVITDSSFINLFREADCLITDSYSFITSWLPTDKPCIFLMNPQGPVDPYQFYYPFIKQIIDSYYVCRTEDDIDDILDNVIINGNDTKKCDRQIQKDKIIYNFGHAGEFIANYIYKQITG